MTQSNKHCTCKEAKYTGHVLQGHGDITHCPYCGRALATGYYIRVYACTFNGEYDDDGDCKKNLYDEKLIVDLSQDTGLSFSTAKERNEYFDQNMKSKFTEPVSTSYEENNHFLIMFGTYTTTGGGAMGHGSFKRYAGQTVQEREDVLPL